MNRNETRKHEAPGFAWTLYGFFVAFFGALPRFAEKDYCGRTTFVRKFQEKNLQIVVTVPVLFDAQGTAHSLNGLYIQFAVQLLDGKKCIELVDSRVFFKHPKKWELITKKKIDALVAHIEDIRPCPRCTKEGLYPYPVQRAEAQVYPDPTDFVQNQCPGCRTVFNSTAGKGIKSALHRFLKKKKA